jgi:hypothetical protein
MVKFVKGGSGRSGADVEFVGDDGCIFADFAFVPSSHSQSRRLKLLRISFDGHGCCTTPKSSEMDSKKTDLLMETSNEEVDKITQIIVQYLRENHKILWEDALTEYGII